MAPKYLPKELEVIYKQTPNLYGVLEDMGNKAVLKVIKQLDKSYHEEGYNIVDDDTYDAIVLNYEILIKNEAGDKKTPITTTGHKVPKGSAVKLPHWMGSMKKMKPDDTKTLSNWLKKYTGPYVISDKLDGVSALLTGGVSTYKLFTRGDGEAGRDISHLIPHLKIPPPSSSINRVVRGEIIITKCDFDILVENKHILGTSNPRNTVAGITNAKKPNDTVLGYIKFVAYELLEPRAINVQQQFDIIQKLGFITAFNVTHDSLDDNLLLTNILKSRKRDSPFEVDGIIVADASTDHGINKSGNPEHSFAFKLPTSEANVNVTDVVWKISKDRLAKPTVHFDTVTLSGVNIQKATGHNAKYIIDNGIGPGAEIVITRSGEVIPFIKRVVSSAQPKLPQYKYSWTPSKVDIIVSDKDDVAADEIALKSFQHTIEKLEIDGLKKANIEKLFKAGIVSIGKLFDLDVKTLTAMNVPGFASTKITSTIQSIANVKSQLTCIQLMVASNAFGKGMGERILTPIYKAIPTFMTTTKPDDILMNTLQSIDGIGKETSHNFIKNIDNFKIFIKDNKLKKYCSPPDAPGHDSIKVTSSDAPVPIKSFQGFKFVFSGPKDKEFIQYIEANGGEFSSQLSKSVNYLIMKNIDTVTGKQTKATQYGVLIMTPEQFMNTETTKL